MAYQATIGLEIHAELKTQTKMFCDSPNNPNEKHPNVNVCPVCIGHPGTLPVINKRAVKEILKIGLALGGKIAGFSQFDRKNYFYPDLPKGYQISQYKHPFVEGGHLVLPSDGKKINITRVHLEEDTGRLVHDGSGATLIDFNRAGVPLMEMVTEPEMNTASEVREFAQEFQLLLRYLDVSDADMEKGQMRAEANISVAKSRAKKLGTKVEIKNLNSFRAVERAVDYEIKRQTKLLEEGEEVKHETRGWDDSKQKTFSQRIKEKAHDYRYFPEPDLPALKPLEEFNIDDLRAELPELPWQKRQRFKDEYKLEDDFLEMVVADNDLAGFFEESISELINWAKKEDREELIKLTVNYLSSDLQGIIKIKELPWKELLLTPENFAELIKMIIKKEISSRVAKDILLEMVESGGDPSQIVEDKELGQVSDEVVLQNIVEGTIKANPGPVADYKAGKEQALQFLVGQGMKEGKNMQVSANPEVLKDLFEKLL